MLSKIIKELLELIKPELLALCIEHKIYIFDSIAYAFTVSAEQLEEELRRGYNLNTEQQKQVMRLRALYMNRLGRNIFAMVHRIINAMNLAPLIQERLTVETAEALLREHAPALYEVYVKYGEQGREWLKNEVEYDLKPFLTGKKK